MANERVRRLRARRPQERHAGVAIINAINAVTDWSIANGNKVVAINMSLGGSSESTGEKTAIQRATNAGILVIASAGNSGSGKVACPACDPNAI